MFRHTDDGDRRTRWTTKFKCGIKEHPGDVPFCPSLIFRGCIELRFGHPAHECHARHLTSAFQTQSPNHMAGPACFVLSPKVRVSDELVDNLICLLGNERDGDSFWVCDTRKIGGTYVGEGRPFVLSSELRDEDELRVIGEAIGWVPLQEVGLAAMCNDAKDHRILAEMALWLSDRLSGVVDLCGEMPFASELGCQSARVSYQAAAGHTAYFSVMDPDGLRVWLASDAFRMVK